MPATAKVSAAAKPRPLKAGDHIFLVDGSSYIFRAYFAMFKAAQQRGQKLTRSDGLPIGGVLAFSNMLWKMLREGLNGVKPTHIAAVFDYAAKSFRNEIYSDYKGHRPEPPDELIPQFPLMRDAVRAFGLIPIEQEGYKADVTIVAGDKDLMQLVRPGVAMFDPMPGRERPIGVEEVIEKFGVPPAKVPEVQALIGDSTDNVPGVPGIGVKTAAQLINEYGDLETLLQRAPEIKQEKRRQALIESAEVARLSKRLVVLDDHVALAIPLDRLGLEGASCLKGGDPKALIAFLKAMEFTSLINRVAEQTGVDAKAIAPDARLAPKGIDAPAEEMLAPQAEIRHGETGDLFPPPRPPPAPREALLTPAALVAARKAEAAGVEVEHARYRTLASAS